MAEDEGDEDEEALYDGGVCVEDAVVGESDMCESPHQNFHPTRYVHTPLLDVDMRR